MPDKTRVLIDFKTGSFIPPIESRLQLASYWGCLPEPKPSYGLILQVNEKGCRHAVCLDTIALSEALEAFTHAKAVFDFGTRLGAISVSANESYRFEINGKEEYLPSTTFVIRHVIAKDGLLRWYGKVAAEGKNPEAIRDAKAEQGKTIHHAFQTLLLGKEVDLTDAPEWLAGAITHFSSWLIRTKFEPEVLEEKVMNPTLKYAGTLDAVGAMLPETLTGDAHP